MRKRPRPTPTLRDQLHTITLTLILLSGVGVGCLCLIVGAVRMTVNGRTLSHDAAAILAFPADSAATFAQVPQGMPILFRGQIMPLTHTMTINPARDAGYPRLLVYDQETYTRVEYGRGSGRKRYFVNEWVPQGQFRVPVSIVLDGQTVPIRTGSYRLWDALFVTPSAETLGAKRYRGFQAGETVLVYGRQGVTGVEAQIMYSGTQAQFAALHERQATAYRRIVPWMLVLGVLGMGGSSARMLHWMRRAQALRRQRAERDRTA